MAKIVYLLVKIMWQYRHKKDTFYPHGKASKVIHSHIGLLIVVF